MNKKSLLLNFKNIVLPKKYFFIFGLLFIFSFIFFQSTFWYQDQTFFIKSKLWSDFAAHIPLIRSFSLGENYSPVQYPMFSGEKIHYHFLFYFLVGLLEKTGFRIDLALNLLSACGMALLLTMLVKLGEFYFNFKTGLLAVLLFLFNGSLTFLKFFQTNSFANFSEFINKLVNLRSFVSFGPWDGGVISAFWNLNIFTNQRHLAFGIGGLFYLIYFFEKKFLTKLKFSKIEFLSIGLLIALLPILHQASFAFLVIYLLLKSITSYKKTTLNSVLFFSLTGTLSAFIYRYWGSAYQPIFELGFLAKDKTFLGLTNYWLNNFGLYVFFIPFVLVLILLRKKEFKKIGIFYLSGLVVFALAHLFRFSPDMINNHKFITVFLLILNLVVASLLVKLFTSKKLFKVVGATIVTVLLTFSGVVDLFPILNDHLIVKKDYSQTEFGRWAVATPPTSVFLVNSYLYNPVSLTGRKLYLDYGYFAWSMGYADKARRKTQQQIFASDLDFMSWCQLVTDQKIDYLVLDMNEKKFLAEQAVEQAAFYHFAQPLEITDRGSSSSIKIYNTKEICQKDQ